MDRKKVKTRWIGLLKRMLPDISFTIPLFALIFLCLGMAAPSHGASVCTESSPKENGVESTYAHLGNSFTACATGTISAIKLLGGTTNVQEDRVITIYEGDGLTGTVLGTDLRITLHEATSFTDWSVIDVSSQNISVTEGDSYTFYFAGSGEDGNNVTVFNNIVDSYSGGHAYSDDSAVTGADLVFEVVITEGASNANPSISVADVTVSYTENAAAIQIDSGATLSDSDGDSEWDGGTLKVQITGNNESGDEISISDTDDDNTTITINGTNILTGATDIGDLSASGGTVTNGTALTITFDSDATNAIVQEVLQSIRYRSSSDNPGTSNRTVTFTATDKNNGSNSDTATISVTGVNDAPEFDDADDTFVLIVDAHASSATSFQQLLATTDADSGQTLTWSQGSTAPSKGSLSFSGTANSSTANATPTSATYTPNSGVVGTDTFTVNVSDGTATDTLTVNVKIYTNSDQIGSGGPSTDEGKFDAPFGVAIHPTTGDIYIAELGNPRVQVFNRFGVFQRTWGSEGSGDGQFSSQGPSHIAFDSSGNLWVADRGNHRIQKFSSTGAYLDQIGSSGAGDGQFDTPNGIAINHSNGEIYVVDALNYRIQVFNSSGTFLRKWGSGGSGNGQMGDTYGCQGIALDSDGNVWVGDADNNRFQKFSSTGTYLMQLGVTGVSGTGNGQFEFPIAVHTQPTTGNIYVVDTNGANVQIFDNSGVFLGRFGSQGSNVAGQFVKPSGIDFDANGNLWVSDQSTTHPRIQFFSVDPPNDSPAIAITDTTVNYTENSAAMLIDSTATVSNTEGIPDWDGGTLKIQITANNESGDEISISDTDGDNTTITISGTNILAGGTVIGDLSATGGVVTSGTALTITFDADATNAMVQEVLQSIRYRSTSDDPGTSDKTVTFTATDKNGGTNDDTATIRVAAVNDEPSLTATGSNPTFTEGGAAATLFSNAVVSTVESGQTIRALTFTVTNVSDGSNERVNVAGTDIELTDGILGTISTPSLGYAVTVSGTTATVSLSGGTLSTAEAQTIVNTMAYKNNSTNPNISNRVVTLTSVKDSGGTADGGDDTAALAIASTVTLDDELRWTGNAGSNLWSDGGNWSLGTVPQDGDDVRISGDSSAEIILDQAVTLNNLTLDAGTIRQGAYALTVAGDFNVTGGTFTGGNHDIVVSGGFTQSGGVFTATSQEMRVAGDFSRSGGTFSANQGSVVMTGSSSTIRGSTTFYRLVCTANGAASLTFEANSTQIVENLLRLEGDGEDKLVLGSTEVGTAWNIQATGSVILDTLDVQDCHNTGSEELACGNSTDSGNNVELSFIEHVVPYAILDDLPVHPVNYQEIQLVVGGIGVVSYRYQVEDEAWSDETSVKTRLSLPLQEERLYTIKVVGKSNSGIWQRDDEATIVKIDVDRTPPAAVILDAPSGFVGRSDAMIRVAGNGVTMYRYSLDAGPWSSPTDIATPISLLDLSSGGHTLAVVGSDVSGNWQAEGSATTTNWSVNMAVPAAILAGMPLSPTQSTSASFSVLGSDAGLDRYAYALDNGDWVVQNSGETIELTGLSESQHTLYVNAGIGDFWQGGGDGTTRTGATTWTWVVDRTPPPAPAITATNGVPTASVVELSWPRASSTDRYRLWYSDASFSESNLDEAIELYMGQDAHEQSTKMGYSVEGLSSGKEYWFAIKAVDASGNTSALSTLVSHTTEDNRPVVTGVALSGGSTGADNGSTRSLTVSGRNFYEASGTNLVRFFSSSLIFDVISAAGSSTELHVDVPAGAPVGTYQLRVINAHGTSLITDHTYTISEAQTPLPYVSSVVPRTVVAGERTTLTITGAHFGERQASAKLVADDGTTVSLESVVVLKDSQLQAVANLPANQTEGFYTVHVVTEAGLENHVAPTPVEVVQPVRLQNQVGSLTTLHPIIPVSGEIPMNTTLTTDHRQEAPAVCLRPCEISVRFEAGTVLEKEVANANWQDYSGLVMPPRQQAATEDMISRLGSQVVLFDLGADSLLRLKSGGTFYVEMDTIMPSNSGVPFIYYISPTGSISLAGVSGIRNGMQISRGGTVLAVREGVPEPGMTTYTLGVVMTHMSDYAAGVLQPNTSTPEKDDESYGPCFVNAVSGLGGGFWWLWLLLGAGVTLMWRNRKHGALALLILFLVTFAPGWAEAEKGDWRFEVGGGIAAIGENHKVVAGGNTFELEVDSLLYPVFRLSREVSPYLRVEGRASIDIYSGKIDTIEGDDIERLTGYTLGFGPVWYGDPTVEMMWRKWRPLVYAGVIFHDIRGGLNYPVTSFDSSWGVDFGLGLASDTLEIRLGSRWLEVSQGGMKSDVTQSSGDLNLSGAFLEVNLRFF